MNEKNLDERQVSNKNKIGNQCFLLLAYLIFADVGLYGMGVRWLSYPLNIFVILLVCLFVYLVRLIASGSYVGPNAGSKRTYAMIAVVGLAISIAAIVFSLISGASKHEAPTEDNGGTILFIISVVMLVIVLAVSLIGKRQDKDGRDE